MASTSYAAPADAWWRSRSSSQCSAEDGDGLLRSPPALYRRLSRPDETVRTDEWAKDRAEGLGGLLRSWMDEENAEEQRETIEYLVRALDEDRLSDCKLFPEELKRKTY